MATKYSEKLKDPRWQKKRLKILERDEFRCSICMDEKTELHVHHLTYTGGMPWEEPDENLKTLCKYCHRITEYYKDYTVKMHIKYKCTQGVLYLTQCDKAEVYFDIIDDNLNVFEFSVFKVLTINALSNILKNG